MQEDDLISLEWAKRQGNALAVLSWAALIFAALIGASVLQCASGPPRATLLDQCVKGCGVRFVKFTDTCAHCVAEKDVWHDKPAQCECVPEMKQP